MMPYLISVGIPGKKIGDVGGDGASHTVDVVAVGLHAFQIENGCLKVLRSTPWRRQEDDVSLQRRCNGEKVADDELDAVGDAVHLGVMPGQGDFGRIDVNGNHCFKGKAF